MDFGGKRLFPHQVEDISKALSKPCALLNWEMGTGKTLSSYAWAKYRGGRTLVIAPAILIRKTWKEELEGSGEKSFMLIENFSDLEKAKTSDFSLISLERVPKFSKRLQKIRFKNLIVDESDNLKNRNSRRAKAVKTLARKISFRLILTGTFTRNNAAEAYNQLELLLNNTPALLCEVPTLLEYDRSLEDYLEKPNPLYGLPYSAKEGYGIFQKNFSPKKTSVFGASKTNQELYNKQALENILQRVRLRRRFDEVKPEGVNYGIEQISIPMTPGERAVYQYIFEEFVRQLEAQYQKSGKDGKTAGMLVIMQQIMALLRGVSHPWTFPHYFGEEKTSKMQKTLEIIQKNPKQKIMFGSPWKETARKYAKVLAEEGIRVFFLESEMSIGKRNSIIEEYRKSSEGAVLVSTMGVLKAGVNLPEVGIVITDSYPWNFAQLSQYFFRAIRLSSANSTQVFCLSNEGSFDTNVFQLIIAKEKINRFIQDQKEEDNKNIAGEFGVNEDMLNTAIQMVREETEGKTRARITWGEVTLSDGTARGEK